MKNKIRNVQFKFFHRVWTFHLKYIFNYFDQEQSSQKPRNAYENTFNGFFVFNSNNRYSSRSTQNRCWTLSTFLLTLTIPHWKRVFTFELSWTQFYNFVFLRLSSDGEAMVWRWMMCATWLSKLNICSSRFNFRFASKQANYERSEGKAVNVKCHKCTNVQNSYKEQARQTNFQLRKFRWIW